MGTRENPRQKGHVERQMSQAISCRTSRVIASWPAPLSPRSRTGLAPPPGHWDGMDYRVQSVIHLMTRNLRQSVTLGEMARSVNLTPEHLCRVFKSHTGTSPARYFKRLKLQRAKELLETTCLRVKEIATAAGMTDQSHFVRDFELEFGLTPVRYRMLHRAASSD